MLLRRVPRVPTWRYVRRSGYYATSGAIGRIPITAIRKWGRAGRGVRIYGRGPYVLRNSTGPAPNTPAWSRASNAASALAV